MRWMASMPIGFALGGYYASVRQTTLRWIVAGLMSWTAAAQEPTVGGDALEIVKRERESVDSRIFLEIASPRDADALLRLQQAIYLIDQPPLVDSAFAAVGWFEGAGELEGRALDFLMREATDGRSLARQKAATRAMTGFASAATRCESIVRSHRDRECRSIALSALLPTLAARKDANTCRLILDATNLGGDSASGVEAALRRFRSSDAARIFADRSANETLPEEVRLLALKNLAEIDSDTARQSVAERARRGSGELQRRALQILSESDPAATLAELKRVVQTGSEREAVEALLTLAAVRASDPEWVGELASIARGTRAETRMAVTRALADAHTHDALRLLHGMLRDSDWRVQFVAVQAVASYRQKESIPRLIAALDGARRRVAEEILVTLRSMTCRDFGRSPATWAKWYDTEQESFAVASQAAGRAFEEQRTARINTENPSEQRTSSFYGLEVTSDRVTFVIDRSNSMAATAYGSRSAASASTRLEVAKAELSQWLTNLVGNVELNVIAFSTRVEIWRTGITRLDEQTRESALRFVRSLSVDGGTAIYDALDVALRDTDVDTLYVLTDGQPSGGAETSIPRIRELISARANARFVRIHGVAVGSPSELLQGLAADTGGMYRYVP